MAKLTEAQRECLAVLAGKSPDVFGGWWNYDISRGVKRHVVRALQARGLAQLNDEVRPGVSARITPAGRAALAEASK